MDNQPIHWYDVKAVTVCARAIGITGVTASGDWWENWNGISEYNLQMVLLLPYEALYR